MKYYVFYFFSPSHHGFIKMHITLALIRQRTRSYTNWKLLIEVFIDMPLNNIWGHIINSMTLTIDLNLWKTFREIYAGSVQNILQLFKYVFVRFDAGTWMGFWNTYLFTTEDYTHTVASHRLNIRVRYVGNAAIIRKAKKKLAGIFITILELVLHWSNILPVRVAIYSVWSLVSSSSVVQQDSFLLIVCPTHCSSWINFLSTFESGTHKVSCSERYTKDLLGLQVCKNVGSVSLSFTCNIQVTTFCHIHKLQILWWLPLDSLHLASVLCVQC